MIVNFFKVCPLCGRTFTGPDEIGLDGHTHMCRRCRAHESLLYIGIDEQEAERVLARMEEEGEFGPGGNH